LESLPSELRIEILLAITDLASLRSLIHASPSYHASYLGATRKKVLGQIALQQLDYRLRVDALAAVRSGWFRDGRIKELQGHHLEGEKLTSFLNDYGRARGDIYCANSEWLLFRTTDEAITLIHLNNAVKRLAEEYCDSIADKMPQTEQHLDLSQMEKLRLYRAIYRFQTYCNFFSRRIHGEDRVRRVQHPIQRFFPSFPPWEVVEIACVWHYVLRRWGAIIREVTDTKLKRWWGGAPDDDELRYRMSNLGFNGDGFEDGYSQWGKFSSMPL
jgi:hypothetical protein